MKVPWLMLIVLLAAPLIRGSEPTAEQQARIDAIEKQLLAPCCWQEPVYGHRSELALQMKKDIRAAVLAGKSDREILDGYIQQYGARILVEPEGGLRTWLYLIPLVALALGTVLVVFLIRRYRQVQPAT